MFEPWMFEDKYLAPSSVPYLQNWHRCLDTAYTTKSYSDHTGTVKIAYDEEGNLYIRGFKSVKLQPGDSLTVRYSALALARWGASPVGPRVGASRSSSRLR